MHKPYMEELKDPRWQKKRLEIFSKDDFKCHWCGDTESPLHVHHLRYLKGKRPWDHDGNDLVTLCEGCHRYAEDIVKMVRSRSDSHICMDLVFAVLELSAAGFDIELSDTLFNLRRQMLKQESKEVA